MCLFKRRRGPKGEPSPGVPPFLCACACAPILWEVVVSLSCHSTPFLWCLLKETVSSRQRKALFLPWRLHHSRERSCLGGLYSSSPDLGEGLGGCLSSCLRRGRTGFVMAASRGRSSSRVSLSLSGPAHHQSEFLWGSTPFLCARAKKWGGTGSRERNFSPGKRRIRTNEKTPPQGAFFVSVCFSR